MEEQIYEFLSSCGFSPRHCGYRYLKRGISHYIQNQFNPNSLGINLYKMLSSDEGGKSTKTIEKNITCAIEWAYLKGDVEFLEKNYMFGDNDRGRPTNNEFIALASNRIIYSK